MFKRKGKIGFRGRIGPRPNPLPVKNNPAALSRFTPPQGKKIIDFIFL
jgi:hypothetical protein